MKRSLIPDIQKDLKRKIVLLSGPRQSGKTTLAKMLTDNYDYLNFDNVRDRDVLYKQEWDRRKDLVIFDEIHKMKRWKSWIKGVYDVEGINPKLIVTGSAKLDTYRKVGDSLAGRYFSYRLHPLDLKELKEHYDQFSLERDFDRLLKFGGFPEPFFEASPSYYRKWQRTHVDIILRQDLIELESVSNIIGIQDLMRLLKGRVGSTISHNNLAQDLGVDPKTVKNWLGVLERLYVIFKVTPYSKKIRNSLLKAPKYYFYDTGQVQQPIAEDNDGARFENLVAAAILKELNRLVDAVGEECELHYLRTSKGEELDFLVVINGKPRLMVEVKWSDSQPSKAFEFFGKFLPNCKKVQLIANLDRERTTASGVEILDAKKWLSDFSF